MPASHQSSHKTVGTYVRASASEGQAKDYQYVMFTDVRQRPNTVGLLVGADARTSVPTVGMGSQSVAAYFSFTTTDKSADKGL